MLKFLCYVTLAVIVYANLPHACKSQISHHVVDIFQPKNAQYNQ